jgi:hypothetical protein
MELKVATSLLGWALHWIALIRDEEQQNSRGSTDQMHEAFLACPQGEKQVLNEDFEGHVDAAPTSRIDLLGVIGWAILWAMVAEKHI